MLAGAALLVTGVAAVESPAAAQSNNISEIIVFGTDPCPRSTDDQVVVCARKPESERYRIPERLRSTGSPQAREAWANKARALETVGATGTNSCSPVGPGGFTGCLTRVIREARQESRDRSGDYNPDQ
jgi:hypothetical protein